MTDPKNDFERRIRFAISDPGAFLPRGDDYTESIPNWGMRAVMTVVQPEIERQLNEVTTALKEANRARINLIVNLTLARDKRDRYRTAWSSARRGRSDLRQSNGMLVRLLENVTQTHMRFGVIRNGVAVPAEKCADWCDACKTDQLTARAETAEAAIARVRALAATWAALGPADDWADTVTDTLAADCGREILATLDNTEDTRKAHTT